MSLEVQGKTNLLEVGKQIETFAKTSRTALTNLSLVVQDLPYGFIGIQNNLPFLVKSFQELSTESGGATNAVKALAGQLIGPAGLFFAFSAITSAVTVLVQKYGSIGNAFDSLFGKVDLTKKKFEDLAKSYEDFNKNAKSSEDITDQATASVEGQILKVQTLSKVLLDTSTSYKNKTLALQQLKQVSDDYFGSLSLKGDGLKTLTELTDKYTQSILNQALAKGYEDEIVETTKEFNKQNRALLDIVKNLPAEYKRVNDLTKANINSVTDFGGALTKFALAEDARGAATGLVNQKYLDQAKIVSDLRSRINDLKNIFTELTLTNLDNTVLDPVKVKKVKDEYKDLFQKLPARSDEFIKFLKETNKLSQDNIELAKRIRIAVPDVGGPINNLKSPFAPSKEDIKLYDQYLSELTKSVNKRANQINNTIKGLIQEPLTRLFDILLTKGKASWQEFGQIVIDVLKRIASELVTTAIASVLANILAPGSGAGVSKLLQGFSTSTLGDYLADTGGQANFGGMGGAMGISGQVVFVQRGSDLVGVLNRTNSTINRVG